MNVLVTGGAGYIGSVTVESLLDHGHEAVVFDSLEEGHRGAVARGAKLVVGDLADAACIECALRENRIDAVIHFAAYSLVGESVEQPARYFRNNIANGLNLLEAMRSCSTRKIVFSSSAAVYGAPSRLPIPEDEPAAPINPYGESKLYFERILSDFNRAYGMDCVSLRYFNAAGATESFGEHHEPETHLIPRVLMAALGLTAGVRIFGDDYPTPDGTCVRDYIHVEDLARAHILALGCTGESVYNLGDERGFSVKEVIEAAREVTGAKINVEAAARRPGDPPVLIASSEKIRMELGWVPRLQGIHEIIESAWRWMKRHPGGYPE